MVRWLARAALAAAVALTAWLGLAAGVSAHAGVEHGDMAMAASAQSPDQVAPKRCVEDTQFMRRNHMDLLKHQRNKTLREGVRTTKHSLKQCVECHASEKTGSVAADAKDFCVSCHRYAAVHLDCWDCHATKPMKKPLVASEQTPASPATAVEAGVTP
jgi:predicted CXXCH cytochrome family protein